MLELSSSKNLYVFDLIRAGHGWGVGTYQGGHLSSVQVGAAFS